MIDRLFVYGTLRRDARHHMFSVLERSATCVGRARAGGRLFDLGNYPGFVPTDHTGSWVHGEVYVLDRPAETLSRLDEYEGCSPNDPEPHEFERVEMAVALEAGRSCLAWVYVFRGPTSGRQEIRSGDFLNRWASN